MGKRGKTPNPLAPARHHDKFMRKSKTRWRKDVVVARHSAVRTVPAFTTVHSLLRCPYAFFSLCFLRNACFRVTTVHSFSLPLPHCRHSISLSALRSSVLSLLGNLSVSVPADVRHGTKNSCVMRLCHTKAKADESQMQKIV